jgi:hypothetical protein
MSCRDVVGVKGWSVAAAPGDERNILNERSLFSTIKNFTLLNQIKRRSLEIIIV